MNNYKIRKVLYLVLLLITFSSVAFAQLDTPIRFAIISDRTGDHVEGIHGKIVLEIEQLKPDFVMTVGDMIEGYVDDSARIWNEWAEYDSIIAPFSMPVYRTPGNHDIWSDMSEDIYRKHISEPYYSFNHKNVHFVILDNSRFEESNDMPSEQLSWLEQDLQDNQDAIYTLVFYHKPLWYGTLERNEPDTLHSLFVHYGVDAIVGGHYHEYFSGEYDGILYTSLGSSGASAGPNASGIDYHYGWVTLDNQGIHVAPIKINSVLTWDQTSALDKMKYDRLKHFGLTFSNPLKTNSDLTVSEQEISVIVDGDYAVEEINDTLIWDIPEGWQINPNSIPISIKPGTKESYSFIVNSGSELYPLPTVKSNLLFKANQEIAIEKNIEYARNAVCYSAITALEIDGIIEEKCWQKPQTILLDSDGQPAKSDQVEFYFAYDQENLYLAAKCYDSKIDSLFTKVADHDGAIYNDDCVGYFIETKLHSDTAYQIYFNPSGVAFDQKLTISSTGWMLAERSWNGNYKTATKLGKDYWSIEVKIPMVLLGHSLNSGDKCRLNFRRKQPRIGDNINWQTPIDYNPNSWGYLLFE